MCARQRKYVCTLRDFSQIWTRIVSKEGVVGEGRGMGARYLLRCNCLFLDRCRPLLGHKGKSTTDSHPPQRNLVGKSLALLRLYVVCSVLLAIAPPIHLLFCKSMLYCSRKLK
jgi:hypothetical protein